MKTRPLRTREMSSHLRLLQSFADQKPEGLGFAFSLRASRLFQSFSDSRRQLEKRLRLREGCGETERKMCTCEEVLFYLDSSAPFGMEDILKLLLVGRLTRAVSRMDSSGTL